MKPEKTIDVFSNSIEIEPGIYEQVISKYIQNKLDAADSNQLHTRDIDKAEAPLVLSQYLAQIVEIALKDVHEKDDKVNLVNTIVGLLAQASKNKDLLQFGIDNKCQELLAFIDRSNPILVSGKKSPAAHLPRPQTSIARSDLFTGAHDEPSMFSELQKEIASADSIDILVAFIKKAGVKILVNELKNFTNAGKKLRIITTTYTGNSDADAIVELAKLPNTEIKINYEVATTSLHAKAYIFHRKTGFDTAYVGSSNLSRKALSTGLEWNVKMSANDQPATLRKIKATFESYWNMTTFKSFSADEHATLRESLQKSKFYINGTPASTSSGAFFNIEPYEHQKTILERLKFDREIHNFHRNLVVAATGTGKTVIAAFDYANYCKQKKGERPKLLFVAHRREILEQSLDTFRKILRDQNFGDLFVGQYKSPSQWNHLFVSIQTLNSKDFCSRLGKNHFDFIILDEIHHGTAPSYQPLLQHFEPKELLGLTATPERSDKADILQYFGNRFSAEIRLPEAIDRKLLTPFIYFGVSDEVDLDKLSWGPGGYKESDLKRLYDNNKHRATLVADKVLEYVSDINEVIGLGFCVSVEHAKFMADCFNERQIKSAYLCAESDPEYRHKVREQLRQGEIHFIFVVDLYNEGVDIPEVNTVLFLRPTESLTVFLQQLGRGLRLSPNKDCLTVLDFIGAANKKYNFEQKFAALMSTSYRSVKSEFTEGFRCLPQGCFIQLEKKASDVILNNLNQSFYDRSSLINRLKSFANDSHQELTLSNFLNFYQLPLHAIYNKNRCTNGTKKECFADLKADAGLISHFNESAKQMITMRLPQICNIDSIQWLSSLIKTLSTLDSRAVSEWSDIEKKFFNLFYITVGVKDRGIEDWNSLEVTDFIYSLKQSPQIVQEVLELLRYKLDSVDFMAFKADLGFDCLLDVHCQYTKNQILLGLDFDRKFSTVREGVINIENRKLDAFFITINKSEKDYSPTTMYNDYALSDELFHWESQSRTTPESETGQRYINHEKRGRKILLFVREKENDLSGTSPYTFLGAATYVSHEGSQPIKFIWKLDTKMSSTIHRKLNRLIL